MQMNVIHHFKSKNFVLSVQFSNKTHNFVKFPQHLCISFESKYRLTHTNLRIRHQRHLKTILQQAVTLCLPLYKVWSDSISQAQHNQEKR